MLTGRVALVTGASRGIGRAIVWALAEQGATVAINYHASEAAAIELTEGIKSRGGRALPYQADVTDPGQVADMISKIKDTFGKIDILVNNAGMMADSLVIDMSLEEWDQVINLNLRSVFLCTRAVVPGMLSQSWGRIINISSQAALTGSRRHAHYAAAKAGLLGFTYSLAKELGPHGITVNAVSPGRIKTDMIFARMEGREEEWLQQTPLRRLGNASEVAAAVAFLASPEASYITGVNLNVNGGLLMG
ncbi:3-oxoacyl-[acyl-carrier-protein] reductase FabG [Moorella thermoacetica]|uniref:3-oxoacyl-[acyl-carrier-protein] reductase FabG n=1 Tax=Neomoorella thermoacetica TaxID=1525 RepID=A0A1J5JN46_NEOTH|nr:3-oxoacyl-ACP reductase family protein [Moorella thermoacetica]OIQ08147.1 3-oxoacyl-[acyl-carrier-protein] reductase FabG [Moorella thermoacetica]